LRPCAGAGDDLKERECHAEENQNRRGKCGKQDERKAETSADIQVANFLMTELETDRLGMNPPQKEQWAKDKRPTEAQRFKIIKVRTETEPDLFRKNFGL
jgi:hypothetical protein